MSLISWPASTVFSEIWSYENVTSDLIIYQRTYEQKVKRQMIVKKYFSVRIFFIENNLLSFLFHVRNAGERFRNTHS